MGKLIVIAGPTASGKTDLSITLAKCIDAEIISADSRQFYKGMDIGTAKPSKDEMQGVPHHFIDIKTPDEDYNAGAFESDCIHFLNEYFKKKEHAILVGGSGLYINAVLNGFDPLPPSSPEVREKWQKTLETDGIAGLQQALLEKDPEYHAMTDIHNPQRLIRALEVIEASGRKYSDLRKSNGTHRNFKAQPFMLTPERSWLYQRINDRVDQMMDAGLVEEVRTLIEYQHCNALQTVGYKEILDFFNGTLTMENAIEKIKQHTRNYAKRQYTWFKNKTNFKALPAENTLGELQKHL